MEPLTDAVIYDHLAGEHTVGVYPLLSDDTCHFLAVDFDEQDWKEDAKAFLRSCKQLGIPAALEVSRSGSGAHAWIFFSYRVLAREARRLGSAVISHTCAQTRQLKLTSYDRLFPNQDSMPKGGFGNLIALPLQKKPREFGNSVFVDESLTLLLAMPVSWKGTLQQYAGRLHREHADKIDVRIIDFVDADQSVLMRMWEKRQRGYRAMGYQILGA